MPTEDEMKERILRMREKRATEGETDEERRERLLALYRGWWQSPDGKKAIRKRPPRVSAPPE